MKLIYLYHSGFALLGEGYTIIFDYFEDSASPSSGIVHDELLQRPGRLYVLSSHSHADHFNKEVLTFREKHPDIVYIFSQDILHEEKLLSTDTVWLKKGDCYADDVLRVHAFGSTDVGISFLVEAEGKKIFHAGDLNNWHWMDESPEEEWKRDEAFFLCELEDIAVCKAKMDVVLFPVDPRLGKEYMRGPLQFVKRIKTTIFVPMHFSEDYQGGNAFRQFAESKGCRFLSIAHRGESFELPNL